MMKINKRDVPGSACFTVSSCSIGLVLVYFVLVSDFIDSVSVSSSTGSVAVS